MLAFAAQADDVYRWVDKDGVVHYSDNPPTPDSKPAELPPLQTFSSGAVAGGQPIGAPSSSDDRGNGDLTAPDGTPTPPFTPKIVSPAANDTIRGAERQVTVVLGTPPPIGVSLTYFLDGKPMNLTPTTSSTFLLNGIDRGEHQVYVKAVDQNRKTLGQSETVTFFMKPPIAR